MIFALHSCFVFDETKPEDVCLVLLTFHKKRCKKEQNLAIFMRMGTLVTSNRDQHWKQN